MVETALHTTIPGLEDPSLLLDRLCHTLAEERWGVPGYVLRRIVLANYWHFDYQDIFLPHGRLFLRGRNASGKSTVLAATIPMVLDGNTNPERLDTFGSTQRKLAAYVLLSDDDGAYEFNHRISYVALEFVWHGQPPTAAGTAPQRVLTIGLCLVGNATHTTQVQVHPFLLENTRLGFDLSLLNELQQVIDWNTFKRLGGPALTAPEKRQTYRDAVARRLFGLADGSVLDDAAGLLLLLRRPNLSSEMKTFSDVYARLKEAFPALPYEVTKDITQAFENLEGLQAHRARVLQQAAACQELQQADLRTLEAHAKRAAAPALTAHRAHQDALAELKAAYEALARDENALAALQAEQVEMDAEHRRVDEVMKALTQDARYQAAQLLATRIEQAEGDLARAERDLTRATRALEASRADEQSMVTDLAARRQTWTADCRTLAEALHALAIVAHSVGWPRGSAWFENVSAGVRRAALPPEEASRLVLTPILGETIARLRHLAELERQMVAHDKVKDDLTRTRARTREQEAARVAAATRLATAQDECRAAWDALVSGLDGVWQQSPLGEPAAPLLAAVKAAAVAHDRADYAQALAAVDEVAAEQTARRHGEIARCDQEIGQVGHEVRITAEALANRERQSDLSPARRPARVRAREILAAEGIDARPLYTLLDVAPGLDRAQAGQVEAMLLDAGLLDALVVPEEQFACALTCLRERGLADCLIASRDWLGSNGARQAVLVVDETVAEPIWRHAALQVLEVLSADPTSGMVCYTADGTWRQGLLSGHAAPDEPLGFLGAASRQERRRQEIARLGALLCELQGQEDLLHAQIATLRAQVEALTAARAGLAGLLIVHGVVQAEERVVHATSALASSEAALATAVRDEETSTGTVATSANALNEATAALGLAVATRDVLVNAQAQTQHIQAECRGLEGKLELLGNQWSDYQDRLDLSEAIITRRTQADVMKTEAAADRATCHEKLVNLRRLLEDADAQDLQQQIADYTSRCAALEIKHRDHAKRVGAAETALKMSREAVPKATETEQAATREAEQALAAFRQAASLHPNLALAPEAVPKVLLELARSLFRGGHPTSMETLQQAVERTTDERRATFERVRSTLIAYDPQIVSGIITVRLHARTGLRLPDLLLHLQEELTLNQQTLSDEERKLFEGLFMGRALHEIHLAVTKAEFLVAEINRILEQNPLSGRRYRLEIKPAQERGELASPLAQRYPMFHRAPQMLSEADRAALMAALRATLEEARRQADVEEASFAELLARLFDYRSWFSLKLSYNDSAGKHHEFSHKGARRDSGAQQLFGLYVPLFAALAALYEGGAPWAPRLFAMDESFDKVSEDNLAAIFTFLAALRFQWIMASPDLSGLGRPMLAACADYVLRNDETRHLAVASPLVYVAGQPPASQIVWS